MAKYTLLELTQKVLASIDGDEVSSITDTVESAQVASIIEDVYYNMCSNNTIPEHRELIKLTALSDTDYPNYLKCPTSVSTVIEFRYNNTDSGNSITVDYQPVEYVHPQVFLQRVLSRNEDASNVQTVTDHSGVKLLIVDDAHPSYWTSFDDEHIVCDSYDSSEDTTLQNSKSFAWAVTMPTFTQSDNFTPDIDDNLFPMLLNEAKSWAHLELKQSTHPKAEQQSRKQRVSYQNDRERFAKGNTRPDYGRK